MKMELDLGKHRNVTRGSLLVCIYSYPTCKSYRSSIFLVGRKVDCSVGTVWPKGAKGRYRRKSWMVSVGRILEPICSGKNGDLKPNLES